VASVRTSRRYQFTLADVLTPDLQVDPIFHSVFARLKNGMSMIVSLEIAFFHWFNIFSIR